MQPIRTFITIVALPCVSAFQTKIRASIITDEGDGLKSLFDWFSKAGDEGAEIRPASEYELALIQYAGSLGDSKQDQRDAIVKLLKEDEQKSTTAKIEEEVRKYHIISKAWKLYGSFDIISSVNVKGALYQYQIFLQGQKNRLEENRADIETIFYLLALPRSDNKIRTVIKNCLILRKAMRFFKKIREQ